jgi:endonuclease/exonuclease/phosphatase family metal-dependent hydrolase
MSNRLSQRRARSLSANLFPLIRKTNYSACHDAGERATTLVASYNVHKCVGLDKRFDPDRTAAVITEIGADIVALQEADQRFGRRAGLLDLARLKGECGLVPVSLTGSPKGHGWHGNVLLFREGRVRDVHQIRLPGVEPRGALVVDVDLDTGPICIVAAHFGLLRRSRARQVETILTALKSRVSVPTLLLGDLNEWRHGGYSSLQNLDPAFGPLTGALPSFPSRYPVFALDRILARPYRMVSSIEVHNTPLARIASDHLPIKARIDLASAAPDIATSNVTASVVECAAA